MVSLFSSECIPGKQSNTDNYQLFWYSYASRGFFQSACDVPELEEKFNIDEYSDMVTLSKPIIYISIEEIINTHSVNPTQ